MSTYVPDVYVPNMGGADLDTLRSLLDQWNRKTRRNLLRTQYYDGKNRLRDLGISIPPSLRQVETVVGWPAKAVDGLAHRILFDGFVLPGEVEDPFGLGSVLSQNRWDVELPQAVTSALIHSVAFLSTLHGDVEEGQPEVLVQAHSGLHSTGLWDRARRCLKAGLYIADTDENGVPSELVMHLPDRVGHVVRRSGLWSVSWRANPTGRVLMEPLVYRPDLDRPFGRSRVSRAVMSITDRGVRSVLRGEISAEFFTAPQRYALGVDDDLFRDSSGNPVPRWQALIGRIWAVGKDEDGDVPTVGQFPQVSMQPHIEQMREIAGEFSGETSLPLSSLGIVQDNPSSAEAIHAAKEDLVIAARDAGTTFGTALVRVAQNSVMLRDGLDRVPDELLGLQANWQNPATPSIVSLSDAAVKQVSAVPWLAETPQILGKMGWTQPEITQLLAERRRMNGGAGLDALIALGNAAAPEAD